MPARAGDPDKGLPTAYIYSGQYAVGPGWDEDAARRTLVAFERLAGDRNWSLLVVKALGRSPDEIMGQLTAARACGVVLDVVDPALLDRTKEAGMPVVVIDNIAEDYAVDTVVQNGFLGGMHAALHLAGRGHRRIGWLGPDVVNSDPQIPERLGGALGGLARAGLDLPPDLRLVAPIGHPEEARQKVKDFLSRADRPTAVLALWQDMTEALVGAARDLGLRPGKDIEFVGWCTLEQHEAGYPARLGLPPDQPMVVWSVVEMTEMAMARLAERRAHPRLPYSALQVPVRLVAGLDRHAGSKKQTQYVTGGSES